MPQLRTRAPRRPAQPSRAVVRAWPSGTLRNMRSFLAAWGMVVTRRVLLVVHYLCHEIVHFRCMYEAGEAKLRLRFMVKQWAKGHDVQGVVLWAAKVNRGREVDSIWPLRPDVLGAR
jgi:hypothetical protein